MKLFPSFCNMQSHDNLGPRYNSYMDLTQQVNEPSEDIHICTCACVKYTVHVYFVCIHTCTLDCDVTHICLLKLCIEHLFILCYAMKMH